MMEIIPLCYGKSVLSESMIFKNGTENKFQPIVFKIYLIKFQNRLILIDAGCETMPGFDMTDFIGPVKALDNIGITPEQITDIIITHSHHDHIECVKYFKNATVCIQKDEYNSGKNYFTNCLTVCTFKKRKSVYKGVKAIKIGGHSKGSSIVKITSNKKTYIIAGDECYMRECLTKQIPTGAYYNLKASRKFIKKYNNKKYTVLLCHDE